MSFLVEIFLEPSSFNNPWSKSQILWNSLYCKGAQEQIVMNVVAYFLMEYKESLAIHWNGLCSELKEVVQNLEQWEGINTLEHEMHFVVWAMTEPIKYNCLVCCVYFVLTLKYYVQFVALA